MKKLDPNIKEEMEKDIEKLRLDISVSKTIKEIKKRKKLDSIIDQRTNDLHKEDLIKYFSIFINNFNTYKHRSLTNRVFTLHFEEEEWKYLNKDKAYKKIKNCFETKIKEDTEGDILKSFELLFGSELILDKYKTKLLVNGKDIKEIIFLNDKTYNSFKEKIISFINVVLEYEFEFIEKEEFKEKSSEIYYDIVMFFNLKSTKNIDIISDEFINSISERKETEEKIKNKVVNWIKNQEKAEEIILQLIDEEKHHNAIEYLYFFNENQKEIYKNKIINNFSLEIKEILPEKKRRLSIRIANFSFKTITEDLLVKRIKRKYDFVTESK